MHTAGKSFRTDFPPNLTFTAILDNTWPTALWTFHTVSFVTWNYLKDPCRSGLLQHVLLSPQTGCCEVDVDELGVFSHFELGSSGPMGIVWHALPTPLTAPLECTGVSKKVMSHDSSHSPAVELQWSVVVECLYFGDSGFYTEKCQQPCIQLYSSQNLMDMHLNVISHKYIWSNLLNIVQYQNVFFFTSCCKWHHRTLLREGWSGLDVCMFWMNNSTYEHPSSRMNGFMRYTCSLCASSSILNE